MKKLGFSLFLLAAVPALANTSVPDVTPVSQGHHVVINIPQQRLFLYTDGKLAKIYPVAVGKAMTQTNLGSHKIGAKAFNPTWHIPKSIQKELNNGVTSIPPGPKNPLGPVFVRLGDPKLGLGIHGTNAPASVPGVRSHGCVRMKSPDALQFAKTITTGSPADVIYQMAALNVDGAGNLWLATLNCLTCGAGKGKISGNLTSLAWTSGSGSLSKPKAAAPKPQTPPPAEQILPEGSEIEIDADIPQNGTPASSVGNMPQYDGNTANDNGSNDNLF